MKAYDDIHVLADSIRDATKHQQLSLPILNGRIGKWILALSEFDLWFESAKVVKGQVMANFVTQHCGLQISVVEPASWILFLVG